MGLLKKLDDHLEEYLLIGLLSTAVVLIATQVFMRYVMSSSLSWTEEMARFLFIWLVYIGISYGIKMKRHIKIDAALILLPEKGKKIVWIIADLLFIVFCYFVIKQGMMLVIDLYNYGQTSPALGIPMAYVYLAAPLGLSLAVIRLIQSIIQSIRDFNKSEPQDDEIEASF
ncbi:TRAP transporter small permease [Desulfofalx alkaliphila]|uniref:TRAP transporter small permease n=1 Tax=Desulfofalx alkaliphila TaxID=105483 RepID=UPI00068AF9FF|nr:TRAP transporter small permease [Desulfofalx alkaliphila]